MGRGFTTASEYYLQGKPVCFSLAAIVQARIAVQKRILPLPLTGDLLEMSMSKRSVNVADLSYPSLA